MKLWQGGKKEVRRQKSLCKGQTSNVKCETREIIGHQTFEIIKNRERLTPLGVKCF